MKNKSTTNETKDNDFINPDTLNVDVKNIDPIELAKQMTLFEFNLLSQTQNQ